MAGEALDICLRVLKESNKSRFNSYSVKNSVLIISHITFRDCRVHMFSNNFSRNSCMRLVKVVRYGPCLFFFCIFMEQEFKVNRKAKKNKAMSSHLDQTSLSDGQKEGLFSWDKCGKSRADKIQFISQSEHNEDELHLWCLWISHIHVIKQSI